MRRGQVTIPKVTSMVSYQYTTQKKQPEYLTRKKRKGKRGGRRRRMSDWRANGYYTREAKIPHKKGSQSIIPEEEEGRKRRKRRREK